VEIVVTPIPAQSPFIPEDAQGSSTGCASGGTLQLPAHCVEVLTRHRVMQADVHAKAGDQWQDRDLVFATGVGTELDAANVRRSFATSSRGPDSTVVVDTPRAAPQLRLSAVRRRSPARRPLSARRARQHRRFGDGLPPGATTGPHTRSEMMDIVFQSEAKGGPVGQQLGQQVPESDGSATDGEVGNPR
jgi:hypothetical protein